MGFPVPANAPQFTVGSAQYSVGAFINDTPIGRMYQVGVFQLVNGGWNLVGGMVAQYLNAGDLLADVKAKGGMAAFIAWLKAQVNAALSKLFGTTVATAEPASDDQALAQIQAAVSAWVVSGTPPQVK